MFAWMKESDEGTQALYLFFTPVEAWFFVGITNELPSILSYSCPTSPQDSKTCDHIGFLCQAFSAVTEWQKAQGLRISVGTAIAVPGKGCKSAQRDSK